MMRIYIAGPMRGYPYFNFAAFDDARDSLRLAGWQPVSPADIDREIGFDPFDRTWPWDYEWECMDIADFDIDAAIRRDVDAVLSCDAIYMLRGWEGSTGARAERALAEWAGLDIITQPA